MSSSTIDDLPAEMVCELFKHLDPKSLIACSLVNKLWYALYARIRLDRLVVIKDLDKCPFKWRYSLREKKRIEERELCGPTMFARLIDRPMLCELKYLALMDPIQIDPNQLKAFSQLVYLEIAIQSPTSMERYNFQRGRPNPVRGNLNFNLSNLKVLAFSQCNASWAISIDCPQLSVLAYKELGNPNLLAVKRPDTIRKLYTSMGGSKLARFQNVECLITERVKLISTQTIRSLPRLQELRYNATFEKAYGAYGRSLSQLKSLWRALLDQATALRRYEFKLVYAGLHLSETTMDEVEVREQTKFDTEVVPNEYFYMMNYPLIDGSLEFVDRLDYSLLVGVSKEIPADFSETFSDVRLVVVNGAVQDPNHLLAFLNSLRRSLRNLHMDLPRLSQEFYDQLPPLANSLVKLVLKESKEIQLSFDFINEIPNLSSLFVEQPLLPESFTSVVRCFSRLVEGSFGFVLKNKWFFIRKEAGSKKWALFEGNYGQNVFVTESSEEMLRYFDELQRCQI